MIVADDYVTGGARDPLLKAIITNSGASAESAALLPRLSDKHFAASLVLDSLVCCWTHPLPGLLNACCQDEWDDVGVCVDMLRMCASCLAQGDSLREEVEEKYARLVIFQKVGLHTLVSACLNLSFRQVLNTKPKHSNPSNKVPPWPRWHDLAAACDEHPDDVIGYILRCGDCGLARELAQNFKVLLL